MDYQEIIFGLIVNGGNARSNSMLAMKLAKQGKIEAARDKIKEADNDLQKAHEIQTNLIQEEAAGTKTEISLLMIHGQDHLMNAMTVRDLANEMIGVCEELQEIKRLIK